MTHSTHCTPTPPPTPLLTPKDSRAPNMSICGLPLMFSDRSSFSGCKLTASNLFNLLYEMSSDVRFVKPLKASLVIFAKIFLDRSERILFYINFILILFFAFYPALLNLFDEQRDYQLSQINDFRPIELCLTAVHQ